MSTSSPPPSPPRVAASATALSMASSASTLRAGAPRRRALPPPLSADPARPPLPRSALPPRPRPRPRPLCLEPVGGLEPPEVDGDGRLAAATMVPSRDSNHGRRLARGRVPGSYRPSPGAGHGVTRPRATRDIACVAPRYPKAPPRVASGGPAPGFFIGKGHVCTR